MKQEILNKALVKIQQNHQKAMSEFEKKMEKVFSQSDFQEMNKRYTRLVIENAKKESNGEKPDKEAENKLKTEIEKLENFEKPNFSCKICCDEGYVNGQMCKCLKKEISNLLLKGSGFEKLEDFDSEKTADDLKPICEKMKQWCRSDFKKNLIYLAGPTGVGKTYILRCMANELINLGKVVKISTAFAINQDFKKFAYSQDESILNKYLSCDVLFIDDFGTEPLYKNVTMEYFYLVINERKMRKLSTVITSNLDLSDLLERYDERIASRIADRATSITIYLSGNDKRLKK